MKNVHNAITISPKKESKSQYFNIKIKQRKRALINKFLTEKNYEIIKNVYLH